MNMADRIQHLRKSKGISQEQLADCIGVSRQAVSKWESEQSSPDLDKVILLSEYFNVTTDYLLKGIELFPAESTTRDPRILAAIGTAVNACGIFAALMLWQITYGELSAWVGLMIEAIGCAILATAHFTGKRSLFSQKRLVQLNIWLVLYIPLCILNNAARGFLEGYVPRFSPCPQLGNSILLLIFGLFVHIVICIIACWLLTRKGKLSPRS